MANNYSKFKTYSTKKKKIKSEIWGPRKAREWNQKEGQSRRKCRVVNIYEKTNMWFIVDSEIDH